MPPEKKSDEVSENQLIVIPVNGVLPKLCILCGQPAQDPPLRFAYSWNPHGYRLGGKTSTFFAVATNRRARIHAYYCEKHFPQVMRNVLVTAGVGVAFFAAGWAMRNSIGLEELFAVLSPVAGALLVFSSLMYYAMPPLMLKCLRIDGGFIWLHVEIDKAREALLKSIEDQENSEPSQR